MDEFKMIGAVNINTFNEEVNRMLVDGWNVSVDELLVIPGGVQYNASCWRKREIAAGDSPKATATASGGYYER